MESYSDLPKLTQQIVKEEVSKEVRNLDLKKVASQLVIGKTNALEDAMFSAVGKSTIRVCGTGAKYELGWYLKEYAPYLIGLGIATLGYFAYQKEWNK